MGLEILGLPQRERQIRRERWLGLEPLGIRGTRHCLRKYGELVVVPPTGAATLTTRPQARFIVDRLVVPDAIARDFVIEDIRIGNVEQIVAGAGIPAEAFTSPDAHLAMDPVQSNQDLSMTVRYVGVDPNGAVFRAAIFGRDAEGRRMVMPIGTGALIGGARDGAWTSRAATLQHLARRAA